MFPLPANSALMDSINLRLKILGALPHLIKGVLYMREDLSSNPHFQCKKPSMEAHAYVTLAMGGSG